MVESSQPEFAPTLQNLIDQKSLKWVFVGGKGGVGKTTTSSSIAVRMAQHRESVSNLNRIADFHGFIVENSLLVSLTFNLPQVLIISTDPAHNLSDAFDQKFTNKPTQIKSISNLYAMEVDPTANESGSGNMFTSMMSAAGAQQDEEGNAEGLDFMKDLMASVPGIDEATSFGEVIKSLDEYNFDLIIFDTAPTGHTLRLLNFPNILEKGLLKLIELKDKFGGMMS